MAFTLKAKWVFRNCCSHCLKNEEWIVLCGINAAIVAIEKGGQKGIYHQRIQEAEKRVRDEAVQKSATKCQIM